MTSKLMVRMSAVLLFVASVAAQGQSPAQTRATLIRGATLLTVTKGTIQNGSILLRDGKIEALGANVQAPAGADIVEAKGKFVTPGIIDAHIHIAADSINEGATTVSSMTGIEDVLNPTDINIYRDLAGGVTSANVLHGSANPIGGTNAVIKLRWGKSTLEEMLFAGAMPGIKFALGENPKDLRQGFRSAGPLRYPITRMGVEYVIRDAFTRAKAYQRAWKDYDERKKKGEDVLEPRRDLQLDPLVEVLEGKRLVHAHSYRADEILMLIRVAEEMGFKIATFQHVLEGYKVAKEIAAHGAGGSTFIDMWGGKIEMVDAIPYNPAMMAQYGVTVSLNSDSAERSRRLNTDAAKAMKWGGVTEDAALAMITINPAKQLRIDKRVGSLEVGKDADVVLWNQHPLSTYAIVDRVYIDGTVYYDRLAETDRLTKVQQEKQALIAAEQGERRKPTTEQAAAPNARSNDVIEGDGGNRPEGTSGGGMVQAPAPASTTKLAAGVLVISNARIHPVTSATIERGSVLVRDGVIQAVGANVTAAGRRDRHRRRRRRRLSRVDQRPLDARPLRPRRGRIRRRQRDARFQSAAAHRGRLPQRQRLDSGHAGERGDHGRRHAGRRHPRRPDRRHEPRWLDLGREHGAAVRGDRVPVSVAGRPAAAATTKAAVPPADRPAPTKS